MAFILSNPNFVLTAEPPCNPCTFGRVLVDFTQMTDEQGDYLISIKSPYVKRKEVIEVAAIPQAVAPVMVAETVAPVAIAAKTTAKEAKTE